MKRHRPPRGRPASAGARSSSEPPRRRTALLLGGALLALLAMMLWIASPRSEDPDARARRGEERAGLALEARAAAAEAARAPASSPEPPPVGAAVPIESESPPEERIVPEPPPEAPPYSPDTLALAEEIHPGTTEPSDAPGSRDGTFRLRFLPVPYVVRAPAPIAVTLELVDPMGHRHAIPRAELMLKTANPRRANPPVYRADFVDSGSGSDAAADDLLYTATFSPPSDAQPDLYGYVLLQIQAALPDGSYQLLHGALSYVRSPGAQITGRFGDYVEGGHLYIGMAVHVDTPGLYRVTGQLFGPNLEPIAESFWLNPLSPGDTRVTLHFFGKVLVDKGVDGPYRLRQVYLSEEVVEEAYSAMGPILEEAWTTRPYKASQFSPDDYEPEGSPVPRIGPDDPSQRDKPPPLMHRPDRSPSASGAGPQPDRAPQGERVSSAHDHHAQ